jgi:hypothetical protein
MSFGSNAIFQPLGSFALTAVFRAGALPVLRRTSGKLV